MTTFAKWRAAAAALVCVGLGPAASASDLFVEIGSRGATEYAPIVEKAVKAQNTRLAILTEPRRRLAGDSTVFTLPTRVILTKNGIPLPIDTSNTDRRDFAGLTLSFAGSGSLAFPTAYRNQLQNTFAAAESAMDAVFGLAVSADTVNVYNYDATIPARQAVSGGIYIPNAPGGPEIRFPIYNSPVAASINFVHTLLLAYLSDKQYPFDAYNEGLVRAATVTVSRVPATIPNSTTEEIEQTLESLYDASEVYVWSNYPGLGAPTFIAPNLLNDPLPAGGSTGGIYLLRYKMSGTAWLKVLVEYPGFIKEFNQRYVNNPAAFSDEVSLTALGQQVINFLAGSTGATVEGYSFADWARRQYILDTRINAGLKLVPEAFPFIATPATSDFGVFGIVLNAFRTSPNGNETLLSGTSYPIYWRNDFTRFFTSAQDDVIPVAGGYGAVAPNFPAQGGSNPIYRTAVDLPYQGKNVRLYFPSGAYSTGTNPSPNNAYGTIVGYDVPSASRTIDIAWSGGAATAPIINGAFGTLISDPSFENPQRVTLTIRQSGVGNIQTVIFNKGRGDLNVDIRSPLSDLTVSQPILSRLMTLGIAVDPYRPNPADLLGLPDDQTLVARWDSFSGRYVYYPDEGEMRQGLGYFIRPPAPGTRQYSGRTSDKTPIAVSLKPGWNLISVPGTTAVSTTDVLLTTSTQAISTWAEGAGTIVGQTFFRFVPDPSNLDNGTFVAATNFQPGEAYYVRSLLTEGAVMVFVNGSRGRLTSGADVGLRVMSRWPDLVLPSRAAASNGGWMSTLELQSTVGQFCAIELGQNSQATAGVGREDSPLPQGFGGFQMASINGGDLYRDVRPVRTGDRFTVRLDGLRAGRKYTLSNRAKSGSTSFTIMGLGTSVVLAPGQSMTFTASGSTMVATVVNR